MVPGARRNTIYTPIVSTQNEKGELTLLNLNSSNKAV